MTALTPRIAGLIGLVIAVLAAGRLLTLPAPPAAPPVASGTEISVRTAWPTATVVRTPGRLGDDRAYTPWIHRDAEVSAGTALTGDGEALRLLVRSGSVERELLRRPATDNPQFTAFATAGDDLVFMLTDGDTSTLYRADWRSGAATVLTADTGTVIFFNSQYDVVIADGLARWAAAGEGGQFTEVRSVPLAGGPVARQRVDGAFALSNWPWLTSVGGGQSGAVELRNLLTGARATVPATSNELVTCGPVWCRVLVLGPAGSPVRTDLMRPDGTDRVRMANGDVNAAVPDVALIDRFEVLTRTVSGDTAGSLTLLLFDIATGRAVPVAGDVATVHARGPIVWWSTGELEADEWFALDLRTLA